MIKSEKNYIAKWSSYGILLCVLFAVCFCILWKANWLYAGSLPGDDYLFLMTTAIGKASHGCTWCARFYPLGHSDYSILLFLPFGKTALAHYIYNCVILLSSSLIMFSFLNKVTENKYFISLFSLFILFSASGFMQIYMECFYPEKTLSFLLCVFIWGYTKARETQNLQYYFLTFLSAAYMTYMKEPFFGVLVIFSTVELLFDNLSRKDKIFNYALLLNSVIFVAIYVYRRLFKQHAEVYASISSDISELSFAQFTNEPILYFIVGLALFRLYSILVKKDKEHIFTDALLFAGTGYAFAYFLLKLTSSYYLFPSVVLFLPAFAVFISNSNTVTKILSVIIAVSCAIPQFSLNKYSVLNVWKHREEDHLFFERIVKEYRAGKKVYWLSDPWLEKNVSEYSHFDNIMCLNRFQHFLNYYSGFQFTVERIFDLSNVDDNCIVLCGSASVNNQSFDSVVRRELSKIGLKQVMNLAGHLMFSK